MGRTGGVAAIAADGLAITLNIVASRKMTATGVPVWDAVVVIFIQE